jgi:hypothetical protein
MWFGVILNTVVCPRETYGIPFLQGVYLVGLLWVRGAEKISILSIFG